MNQKHRTLIIILAVVGLVAVAAATAFLLSSGDDETDSTGSSSGGQSTEASGAPASGPVVAETQPVEVVGTPLPMLDDPANDPAVGLEMPVIEGKRFDGSAITIGGPSDGPTMYVFLAHWCPHCNDEIPELIELNDGGDIPVELNVIGVSTAVAPDGDNYPPSQWIIDKGWPWDVMADDDVATAFVSSGGSGFPYTVLVDADGNVIARATGNRPADAIKAWIDAGLATTSA